MRYLVAVLLPFLAVACGSTDDRTEEKTPSGAVQDPQPPHVTLVKGQAAPEAPAAPAKVVYKVSRAGPPDVPGVTLSGHTDVVPVDGQSWTSDPFVLAERDGRYYGRGTADMKGFLACTLAAVPQFLQRQLTVPIHLAFSYDEEIGCLGVRPLIAELNRRAIKSRAVIVGEPTSMTVVDAHKGPVRWHVTIRGRAAR